MKQTAQKYKEGLAAGIPVIIGYFPVAMAFGLLAKTVDISLRDTFLFSSVVFAGASQFMALDLIHAGIGSLDILLATFLLNSRHFMMSASLALRLEQTKKRWLPFVAFGITDESFSILSLRQGKLEIPFVLALQGIGYLSWIGGTLAGYLIGSTLPQAIQSSMGLGLYAMFTAILIPEIRKSSPILLLSLSAAALYTGIAYFKLLPAGWSLIATIISSSLLGLILIKREQEDTQ